MIQLRDYQLEAADAVEAAYERGVTRPLLSIPTGGGKTLIFSEIIRRRNEEQGMRRALILAHREELIQQAIAKMRMVYPGAECGVVKAGRNEYLCPIVVASVQTLSSQKRLNQLFSGDPFDTIVVDEAHHATAPTYMSVLERAGSFRKDGPLTVGVTATAKRSDGTPLGDVWQEIVFSRDLLWMIQRGYLSDLRALKVNLDMDLGAVHTRGGDFATGELEDALRNADAPRVSVQSYQEHAQGRTAIVFTASVGLAHETAGFFEAAGISAGVVDGNMSAEARYDVLRRLHTGDLKVVTNCAVLTEGFDEPVVDCVILARPTKSWTLYTQMVGRGTRLYPGKDDCLVIDLVGSTSRHKLVNMGTLLGSEAANVKMREGESIREAVARTIDEEQAELKLKDRAKLVAKVVDLFTTSTIAWVNVTPDHYVMDVGKHGMIHLYSKDGLLTWGAWHVYKDGSRVTIATDLDLGYAQGVAEDYSRRLEGGSVALTNKGAAWRSRKPTPGQLEALAKWGLDAPKTCGEASDMLAAASARAAARRKMRRART